MKKGMMVVTMFVAISFHASMTAVTPSFAAQATKIPPTSKQPPQQPAQTPATQQKIKQSDSKPTTYEKAKEKFWDLAVDHCVINNQLLQCNPCQGNPAVRIGQPATITCYYTIKAIQISNITEADAKFWGSGNLKYYIGVAVYGDGMAKIYKKEELRSLPKFTWKDVLAWKKTFMGTYRKTWIDNIAMTWTPKPQDAGEEPVGFSLGPNYGGASHFVENEAEDEAALNNVCNCSIVVTH